VANLIDSGWAAWLPFELIDALTARDGGSAERRAFRRRLERPPEAVELVLTLDHDDVRDLEEIRAARDLGRIEAVPHDLPELGNVLGGGKTGRNDPCPCGSGKKFKRCHGR